MIKTDIIETKSGKIQGYIDSGIHIFKGIPYAEPPIEDLRFKPPVDKKPWNGVCNATEYGPDAFQGKTDLFYRSPKKSEDCLMLNVWTPGTDEKKRPVMFWIHGGDFIAGSGASPLYDGSNLSRHGDVVIVTINYRLGAFGFLYIPGVTANVGLLDQIAALKWVRDNIKTFGGDPNNITIFGQSAGGHAVITLLAMPSAKGLFHRIISQSSGFFAPKPNEKTTKKLFRELGLKPGNIDELRNVPAKKIMKAQKIIYWRDPMEFSPFAPRIDGDTIPKHPMEAIKNGAGKDIEILIGCTLDEVKLLTALILKPIIEKWSEEELKQALLGFIIKSSNLTKEKFERLFEIYKEVLGGSEIFDIIAAIHTDAASHIPVIRHAEALQVYQENTYHYIFTWPSPAMGGKLGACHMIELPFIFSTLHKPKVDLFFGKGPDAENLSEKMMDTWVSFARNGNPNHDGIPEWPSYDIEKRSTMMFGKEIKIVEKPFEKERATWDDVKFF